MKIALPLVFVLLFGATAGWSRELAGRKVSLEAGAARREHAVVSLPLDTAPPDGMRVLVHDADAGKNLPATVRDGELVFIVERALAGSSHAYEVLLEEQGADAPAPRVVVKKQQDADVVDVYIDDVHFTSYHYSGEWKKPFLWPVYGETGEQLTRPYPMDEGADIPEHAKDHPHHKSLYTAYGEVCLDGGDPVDLWAEGNNSGFQHVNTVTWGSGDAFGWVRSENVWQDGNRAPLIDETREYRFYATPAGARFIDAVITFTASYGEVKFKDTKEGGIMAVRMHPSISGRGGKITNAEGDEGERNCWGKPSAWCDYSADIEGMGWRGITVFDHPDNLRHPSSWHIRQYGLMGANSFGYSYFSEKDYNKGLIPDNGDYVIPAGESLVFHYRIYAHSGSVVRARVKDRYADYSSPPTVAWVD